MDKSVCKKGSSCNRKSPKHFEEYDHPSLEDVDDCDQGKEENVQEDEDTDERASSKRKRTASGETKASKKVKDSYNPLNFFLTKVKGIDSCYNNQYTASPFEILSSKWGDLQESVQFNYMFEVDWMMEQYPPCFRDRPILIVAQDKPQTKAELQEETKKYKNIRLAFARLIDAFGTHHTKMMILRYTDSLRVVILTANMIERDWAQKTQGLWISPQFPLLPDTKPFEDKSPTKFQTDLIEYLSSYNCKPLETWIKTLKRCDMSEAKVFLIGSVPGRHTGAALNKFGHMKLRKILSDRLGPSPEVKNNWPVVGQFSSIGTLGSKSDQWLTGQFLQSLRTLPKTAVLQPTPLKLVFPCIEDVRNSLEGYAAGGSLPYSMNTHIKQTYLTNFLHRWKSDGKGRTRASPHIKSYFRASPKFDSIAWGILTSANLSKAAWGTLEKNASQLCIRSYELGVLFVPEIFGPLKTFRVSSSLEVTGDGVEEPISFPVPFDFPLTPYDETDEPWVWDVPRKDLDSHGNPWLPS